MFNKLKKYIIDTIKEEYKFIIFMTLLLIILNIPVNYYIVVGGGISPVNKRIEVENKNESKGSFNISYVSQLDGTILSYLLSYVFPTWERENPDLYKYDESESLEDIDFRSDLDLKTANGNATYWAYTLANKKVEKKSSHLYVIGVSTKDNPELKIKDEIIAIEGQKLDSIEEYKEIIKSKEVGEELEITIIRNDKEETIKCKIKEENKNKVIGVYLQYVSEYDVSPKVNIKFKSNESGPSAGLITTLEIYNQLTKKDITKGYTIAGTGTIESDGSIGEIGGIEYKVLGAAKAKADIFLAPSGDNYEEAKKYIKDKKLKIKLIEIKSINDAINKLEALK